MPSPQRWKGALQEGFNVIGYGLDALTAKKRFVKEQAILQQGTRRIATGSGLPNYNQKAFSFSDAQATVVLPFKPRDDSSAMKSLPGLVLVSWSTHRDKYPVVSCGRKGIKGYTAGHTTFGGTLGFNSFGRDPFQDVINSYCSWVGRPESNIFTMASELPPFDLNLVFYDEYGNAAACVLRGLTIIDTSSNLSVQDVQLTLAYSFMCASISNITEFTKEAVQKNSAVLDQAFYDLAHSDDVSKFIVGNNSGGEITKGSNAVGSGVQGLFGVGGFFNVKPPPE